MFHFRSEPQTAAAHCGGHIYPLSYTGSTPYIDIEIGGEMARAMLDYGATKSSLRAKTPADVGHVVKMQTSLPIDGESEFLTRNTDPETDAILGTDILGRLTVALDGRTAAISTKPCAASGLKSAGFTPIDQRGFFAPDRSRVARDKPNVPVVFVKLGQTKTWAQIDTGYDDDLYPYSVDINQPFYNELVASGATLKPEGFVTVRTCAGLESRPIYSSTQTLVITDEAAKPVTETRKYYLIVKMVNICGGIANRTNPAAQLGSSFMNLFQSVVFDPNGQLVWLKKN